MPKNNKFADDGLVTDFAVHVKGRVANLEDRGDGWDSSISSLNSRADGWDGSVTDLTSRIQTEGQTRAAAISALGGAFSADLQDHADYAEGHYAKKADLVSPGRKATIRHVEGVGGSPTYEVIRVSAGALNLKKIYQPVANAQGIAQNHNKGVTWTRSVTCPESTGTRPLSIRTRGLARMGLRGILRITFALSAFKSLTGGRFKTLVWAGLN